MSVYEVPHAVIVIEGCVSLSWCSAAFYSQSTVRKRLFIVAAGTGCKFLQVSAELDVAVYGNIAGLRKQKCLLLTIRMFCATGMAMLELLQTDLGKEIDYIHPQPSFLDRTEEIEVVRFDLQQKLLRTWCNSVAISHAQEHTSRRPFNRM